MKERGEGVLAVLDMSKYYQAVIVSQMEDWVQGNFNRSMVKIEMIRSEALLGKII